MYQFLHEIGVNMSKKLITSYQFKLFIFIFIFLSVSFISIAYLGKAILADVSEKERGNYLVSFTKVLEAEIPSGGYQEMLIKSGLVDAERDVKIKALENMLSPTADYVSTLAPGLGVGYYSNELDAILTYAPTSEYKHFTGVSIEDNHPGRQVMQTNIPLVNKGAMVRGEILNAMLPIERQGKVIGYIWANQLAQKLDAEFEETVRKISIMLGLCFLAISFLLAMLAVFYIKDIAKLVSGLENIRNNVSSRMPAIGGKLGEVAQGINSMTEQIALANTETARAMLTLQNILDNIDVGVFIYDVKKKEIVYANKYTQSKLSLSGILGETFSQTFYHADNFTLCPCYDKDGEPNFDVHRREFFITEIQKNVMITERLVTWHDGRVLLMLVVSQVTS